MPDDGWAEWSKHVLKELERLNDNHETVRDKLEIMQQSLVEIKSNHSELIELKEWKKSMNEVASPTQLKEHFEDVGELKAFKTKIIAVTLALNAILVIILTILGLA